MPRERTPVVSALKEKLIARLRDGIHRPGQRFFSNRALARSFGVSYQTAHRLIAELEAEGWLERRAASGTYVAGKSRSLSGAELLFHARARRPGSFGAQLLELLVAALRRAGISTRVRFVDSSTTPGVNLYPVVWECPSLAMQLAADRRYILLLNNRPSPGLAATFVDSVSTDDFSGGAAAAEILREIEPKARWAVFAGPSSDERSQARVAGFVSICPDARTISADSWYFEDAIRVAPRMLHYGGVFCCNDRLGQALVAAAHEADRPVPTIVGFDNAPIAEQLDFTTIAIPWREIVGSAVEIVRRRLAQDHGPAAQLIFAPRPVMRGIRPSPGARGGRASRCRK